MKITPLLIVAKAQWQIKEIRLVKDCRLSFTSPELLTSMMSYITKLEVTEQP
jgi:hypothetical protein